MVTGKAVEELEQAYAGRGYGDFKSDLADALVAFLALIEPGGFVVASTILFAGAAFAMGSRRLPRDIALGLVLATSLYVGFTRGLGLDLPAGVLGGLL